ncbi:MAG: putative toxin-antitoxin system toxin component, PIN family [Deltaproteobacteria bacterium]|nr:putative toxin-antitoxin system toxin component, PIN family [Deltaproteobacteria bacterium]
MLKVVLDTSILVSAFLKHEGVNAKILHGGKDEYELYLSEDILEETSLVLLTYERIRKKYHYTDDEAFEYLETLRVVAREVIKKLPKIRVIERDPKDDPILACALKVKADYIVSKDDHLTDLKEYRGIKIVSSQEFLELLK